MTNAHHGDGCKGQGGHRARQGGDSQRAQAVPEPAQQAGWRDLCGGSRGSHVRLDPAPQIVGGNDRVGGIVEGGKMLLPDGDLAREDRVGGEPAFGGRVRLGVQQAQDEFGGVEAIVAVGRHPMHSCREARPRRIQLLMVPSGIPSRPANSPWLKPWT